MLPGRLVAPPCIRSACLASVVALAGCAANGVTLRSNHYRVSVPPGWQVVEGGGAGLPTVLRVPPAGDAPGVELRLYAWPAQGPFVDAVDDAFHRLAEDVSRGLTRTQHDPCPGQSAQFFVFGAPAGAIHAAIGGDRPAIVTAGHASGSLVTVVAAADGPVGSRCAAVAAMDSAIKQVTGLLAPGGDLSRPPLPPVLLDQPGGRFIELPPADPMPLP